LPSDADLGADERAYFFEGACSGVLGESLVAFADPDFGLVRWMTPEKTSQSLKK
jgi:hypothetical protein